MQRWLIITSIQIYDTISRPLRLTAWISQMGKTMVSYRKILAALVNYRKDTNLWYVITALLFNITSIQIYDTISRSLRLRWFIITSIQIYGTISRPSRLTAWISQMGKTMVAYRKIKELLVYYHNHTTIWSCSPRSKKCWSMITSV